MVVTKEKGFTSMEILRLENLNLKITKEFYVLYNINLTVNSGEHILILGSNGSGRTPLLRCICGLEKNYNGQIILDSQDVKKFDFSSKFQLGYLLYNRAFTSHSS